MVSFHTTQKSIQEGEFCHTKWLISPKIYQILSYLLNIPSHGSGLAKKDPSRLPRTVEMALNL